MHCATKNSNKNTMKFGEWERASFAAYTQSFLSGKFFTARLEVLTNLSHAGVFQMSTMVNLGVGFKFKSLWLVQALNLTRRWAFAPHPATRGTYKFQLARKWCESEKMSCHAVLKNLYEPKMDVILTISFKITVEIEITKHMFCVLLCRRGRVSSFCQVCKAVMFFHSFTLFIHCHGICVCIMFLLLIAQLMQLDHLAGGSFIQNALN